MVAYKKLSRVRPIDRKYSRLWLADDHVLLSTMTGYTEEYRRFYFSEIQAIYLRKVARDARVDWILVIAAVILMGVGIFFSDNLLIAGFMAALPLALLTVDVLFGSNCMVEIQTAVSTQLLSPLNRLSSSKRIIAQLVPLITAAQGEVTSEQLATVTAPPTGATALS